LSSQTWIGLFFFLVPPQMVHQACACAPRSGAGRKEITTMTIKQRLFFTTLYSLVILALGALIAGGTALYHANKEMFALYCFVELLITAASAESLLKSFAQPRLAMAMPDRLHIAARRIVPPIG
jgi:hypothetical protein